MRKPSLSKIREGFRLSSVHLELFRLRTDLVIDIFEKAEKDTAFWQNIILTNQKQLWICNQSLNHFHI